MAAKGATLARPEVGMNRYGGASDRSEAWSATTLGGIEEYKARSERSERVGRRAPPAAIGAKRRARGLFGGIGGRSPLIKIA